MLDQDIPSTCQIPGLNGILYGVFGDKKDGTFVEIGAYDGVTYSNTWGLAVMGWRGLCAEPVPELAEQCRGNHKDHSNVKVVEVAIGPHKGELVLYHDGRELYTGSPKIKEVLGANTSHITVPMTTLNALLKEYNANPVDLLVIDVEGMEMEVLETLFDRPTMVIVEAHERHKDEAMRFNAKAINTVMGFKGYRRIYSDGINNIYLYKF